MFQRKDGVSLTKEEIAKLLKCSPKALQAFENAYQTQVLDDPALPENLFEVNAKQAVRSLSDEHKDVTEEVDRLIDRIVNELLNQTEIYSWNGQGSEDLIEYKRCADHDPNVTLEEIKALPKELRPQVTGTLMKKDLGAHSCDALLYQYQCWKKETDPKKKQMHYHMFRQGLDILDLDPITYEMLGMNPNSMGHWLPALVKGVKGSTFFKIPATRIMKVPITLLQLSRTEYAQLTQTTRSIIDRYCMKAFQLDETKDYFIKTGTHSSKFDFRNAHVHGAQEVRELGEYLMYIQFQASMMAGPLTGISIYGVSTTNEWVVREFIKDKEANPMIYKGMPLHTEYRLFVDFDTNNVIGMNPYWDPNVMKQRFGNEPDKDSLHNIHDYVIYLAHEKTLMSRYETNKERVKAELQQLLPNIDLTGQWSVDIMQNGDDFWIIDMALAADSALAECVPKGLLKKPEENWLPIIRESVQKES